MAGLVDKARAEGYTEDEIQAYLAPKVAVAQQEGHSPEEIGKYLGIKPVDHDAAQSKLADNVYDFLVKRVKNYVATKETEAAVVSGFAFGFPAYLVGGVGGLVARAAYDPTIDPKKVATEFSNAVTYDPRTDTGKQYTNVATYPLQMLSRFKQRMGEAVADKTGSAPLAAITDETIGMLPAVFLGGLVRSLKGVKPENTDFHTAASDLVDAQPAMSTTKPVEAAPPVEPGVAPRAEPVVSAEVKVAATKELATKAQETYEKTGIDPVTLKEAALKDPVVMADLASDNKVPFEGPPAPPRQPPAPPPAAEPTPGSPEAAQKAVLDRVSVGEVSKKGWSLSDFYAAVKDELYPINKIEKALNSGKLLDTAESPHKLAVLVRGSAGKATQFLDYGSFDWATLKNTGPGLKQILAPFDKDLDGFRAFAVAKRAEELHGRGIETGIPPAEASAVVKNGGKYEAAFKQLQAYQNSLTKYMKDAGLLSEEGYQAVLEANKDYVPFHRVLEGATGGTGAGLRVHNPLRAIKGSERQIVDPLESIIKNTYVYTALAERNAVGTAFGELIAKNPADAEALGVSKVKQTMRPITLDAKEIRKLFDEFVTMKSKTTTRHEETTKTTGNAAQGAEPANKVFEANKKRVEDALTARGFSPNEAEIMMRRLGNKDAKGGDTIIEKLVQEVVNTERVAELDIRLPSDAAVIFRPNAMRPEADQIRYFEEGKAVTLKVPQDVADAFNATDQQSAGLLLKILSAPAKTLRAGSILAPDFMLRNVIRDQLTAFSFSKNGYIPVWDMMSGAMSLASKGEAFQSWLKSGGANAAMVAMDREYLQQHLVKLNTDAGLLERGWNIAKSPLDVLRVGSELLENATRLGEFKRAMAGTTGSKAAIQEAGFDSREVTLDFQRIGAQTRGLNMISAFMNAGLEGIDRTTRAFIDNPLGTTAKVAAGITLPSVLLWYANNSTPERQARWREIPNWQRDLFWIVMTDEHTYRVPKPFDIGVIFGSGPERMLDAFVADKPAAMQDFMKSIAGVAMPNTAPTFAVPIIEQMTNYSMFVGRPLIPRRLESILPEYQYHEYSTELAKATGQVVGAFPGLHDQSIASPIVLDNYVRGWTGSLGVYVEQALDAGLRKAGVLPDPPQPLATLADIPVVKAFVVRYPSATAQSVQDFYTNYADKKKGYDTFQYLVKSGDAEAALKEAKLDPSMFARLDGMHESVAQINGVIRAVYRNPDMTPSDKRQLIDSMYGQMIDMTRAGNAAMRDIDAVLNAKPAPVK